MRVRLFGTPGCRHQFEVIFKTIGTTDHFENGFNLIHWNGSRFFLVINTVQFLHEKKALVPINNFRWLIRTSEVVLISVLRLDPAWPATRRRRSVQKVCSDLYVPSSNQWQNFG